MKRVWWILAVMVIVSVALTGCGGDDGDNGTGVTYAWQTIFRDNFNKGVQHPRWTMSEGEASNFFYTDSTLAVDDTDAFPDGPLFFYVGNVTDNQIRVTCKINTLEKTGAVQLYIILRASGEGGYAGVIYDDDTMSLIKVDNATETTLATGSFTAMGANETRDVVCEYNKGTLTFTIRDESGVLESITAKDSSPMPAGTVGFLGEIEGSDNEYLHFNYFWLEKYASVSG